MVEEFTVLPEGAEERTAHEFGEVLVHGMLQVESGRVRVSAHESLVSAF
jgi:hypothetical protein